MQNADEIQGIDPALDADNQQPEPEITEQVDGDEPESSTEQEDAVEQPKKSKGVQVRIDELTAARREAERRALALEEESAQLRRLLEMQMSGKQKEPEQTKAQPVESPPKPEQFDTYEEYTAAHARFEARQEFKRLQDEQRIQAEASARREKEEVIAARVQEFSAKTPDYFSVVSAYPITDAMVEVFDSYENGPEIAYALGKNPDVARRIATLTPLRAAAEIGAFVKAMSIPQPRTITGAPPPVAPISGGLGSRSVDPDRMSTEEWLEWRRQQLKR